MFKKGKENCQISRQMVDFFNRQLSMLKEIANKMHQIDSSLAAEQIKDCATLIQKRILFILDQKTSEDFHDYVSDFYQGKLEKMRKELNRQLAKNRQLNDKLQEFQRSLKLREEVFMKSKPVDLSVSNENLLMKNDLIHSQNLIKENQQIIREQNRLLEELNQHILKIEERQRTQLEVFQKRTKELDDLINSKKKRITQLTRQFELESKKLDKDFRQLELINISLVEQKEALQSQVVLKSQEIGLLSKKIYDLNLIISKFQREIHLNESILEEEKIGINRILDENKKIKERIREIQRQGQLKVASKANQIKQLQQRITKLGSSNKELEIFANKCGLEKDKLTQELKFKSEELKLAESGLSQLQKQLRELQKEKKRLEAKDKDNTSKLQLYQEVFQEKEQEINKYKSMLLNSKNDFESTAISYQREKHMLKKEFQEEFDHLVQLNKEMFLAVENTEKCNKELKKQIQNLSSKIMGLNQHLYKLQESFEEAKKMINRVEQQKQDLDFIRGQLELKLKHTERKCQEFQQFKQERETLIKKAQEIESSHHSLRTTLRQKELELQKCKTFINDEKFKSKQSEGQNFKQLKQQLCKKEFINRQINSKLNEVQGELRQTAKKYERQKQMMTLQIKQLQKIIQDNFDHSSNSNRLIDSSLV